MNTDLTLNTTDFAELLVRFEAGDLSVEEQRRLEDDLQHDAARRDAFILFAEQSHALSSAFAPKYSRFQLLLWKPLRILAAAAVIAVCAGGALLYQWQYTRPFAKIEALQSVSWNSESQETSVGTLLSRGDCINIQKGLVELSLGNRGRMILEGPLEMQFMAGNHAILHSGRAVLKVTEDGHGYRLETPTGTLVDLGTEFGVAVNADGSTETQVFQGSVRADETGGDKYTIKGGSGLRQTKGDSMIPIAGDSSEFYTTLPPRSEQAFRRIHWDFDDGHGLHASPHTNSFASDEYRFDLISGNEAPPDWIDGPFGQALHFSGNGDYAASSFPGIGGRQARTVAFWLRVPNDFRLEEGFAIVSWGKWVRPDQGCVWQISVNPAIKDGPVGRLRVGAGAGGTIVGTSDLRDGKWHHISIVMYGGSHPDIGTHVLVYLDGKLESLSRKSLHEVDTCIAGAKHGVWLARDITYEAESMPRLKRFFRGSIDELFIGDAALTDLEIHELMHSNALSGAKHTICIPDTRWGGTGDMPAVTDPAHF